MPELLLLPVSPMNLDHSSRNAVRVPPRLKAAAPAVKIFFMAAPLLGGPGLRSYGENVMFTD